MTREAVFVTELTVTDPDYDAPVEIAVYKDKSSGGMFAIDSSYLLSLDDDEPVIEPFNETHVMLVGD